MAAETSPVIMDAPASFKSPVWGNFGFLKDSNRKTVICKVCKSQMAYSGNTTNMATHLRRHHSIMSQGILQSHTSTKSDSCIKTLPKITAFSSTSNTKLTSQAKSKINSTILEFLVDDLRPFRLVESPKFRRLLSLLEPRYNVPSRQYFSETMLPLLYESNKSLVMNELRQAAAMAITTDGWTSRATESYVTVTAQFIDKSWKMKNFVLQTRRMDDNHTAANLSTVLMTCVEEWGLKKNAILPALVSDNAANMVAAAREGGFDPYVRCFAHTLNLAAQRGLKVNAVANLLAKIRRIVAFFHKSTVAAASLKEKQKLLGIPPHKLKIDVCTRWNSAFDMVERYLEQQAAVYAALLSTKELRKRERDITALSDSDIVNAEYMVVTMKQLKAATLALCTEEGPTLSLIIPLLHKLRTSLKVTDQDPRLIKDMKVAISADLLNRYTDITELLEVATSLDPRFKNMPFLTDEHKATTFANLQTMVEDSANLCQRVKVEPVTEEIEGQARQVQQGQHEPVNPPLPSLPGLQDQPDLPQLPSGLPAHEEDLEEVGSTSPSKSPPKKKKALDELLGDVFIERVEPPRDKSVKDLVSSEMERYKEEPMIPLQADPLMWWKEHSFFSPSCCCCQESFGCPSYLCTFREGILYNRRYPYCPTVIT